MREKKLDLSLPQVAGSAIAAVVAAKLASAFGVYGTILGAGLVSVVATCGGSVFQHFFQRTGEQIRDAATTGRPPQQAPSVPGEFTEGTVYRARVRGWKRPAVAAALVFGVTMAGITTYELVSGSSFSGDGGTTVGDALSGNGTSSSDRDPDQDQDPTNSPDPNSPEPTDSSPSEDAGDPEPVSPPSGTPSASDDGGTTPAPTPTPSAPETGSPTPGASATTPEPSASSRSGTADPDRAGPEAP